MSITYANVEGADGVSVMSFNSGIPRKGDYVRDGSKLYEVTAVIWNRSQSPTLVLRAADGVYR